MSMETFGGGIGFCGLPTIVFITLKLCHVIDWSWLWVLVPIWIPTAIVFSIFATATLAIVFYGMVKFWKK